MAGVIPCLYAILVDGGVRGGNGRAEGQEGDEKMLDLHGGPTEAGSLG